MGGGGQGGRRGGNNLATGDFNVMIFFTIMFIEKMCFFIMPCQYHLVSNSFTFSENIARNGKIIK